MQDWLWPSAHCQLWAVCSCVYRQTDLFIYFNEYVRHVLPVLHFAVICLASNKSCLHPSIHRKEKESVCTALRHFWEISFFGFAVCTLCARTWMADTHDAMACTNQGMRNMMCISKSNLKQKKLRSYAPHRDSSRADWHHWHVLRCCKHSIRLCHAMIALISRYLLPDSIQSGELVNARPFGINIESKAAAGRRQTVSVMQLEIIFSAKSNSDGISCAICDGRRLREPTAYFVLGFRNARITLVNFHYCNWFELNTAQNIWCDKNGQTQTVSQQRHQVQVREKSPHGTDWIASARTRPGFNFLLPSRWIWWRLIYVEKPALTLLFRSHTHAPWCLCAELWITVYDRIF